MALATAAANLLRRRAVNCVLLSTLRSTTRGSRDLANVAPRLSRPLTGGDNIFLGGHALRSRWLCSPYGLHGQDLAQTTPGLCRAFSSGGEPPHQKIAMPALSPTMTQGNVLKWKKNEGDEVVTGDVLCEIETDKATLDLEAMDDGFFAKVLVPAGSKDIPVGQPLCIVVEDKEDVGKFANYSEGASAPEPSAGTAESKQPAPEEKPPSHATSSPAPDVPHQNIAMPALSPTMTQGNVLKWKKGEGEKVVAGDVLCEIETDKATLDMEAMDDGYLAKILVQAGSKDIPVGQSLCVVVEEEDDVGKFKDYTGDSPSPAAPKKTDSSEGPKTSEPKSPSPEVPAGPKKNRVGPSVRRYLAESGLDASNISGTGPGGMLVKGDILLAMKSGPTQKKSSEDSKPATQPGASKPSPPKAPPKGRSPLVSEEPHDDFPNTQIRKIIATRLLESKTQIPHLYLSADATLDPTLQLRKNLKEKHGTSVSVNDFVIRAAALALKEVPEANAFWDEKSGDIMLNKSIDISVAVATDKGLMTPIVKDADQKSLSVISAEVKSLAERARAGKLKPQEFQGGTFSISNLGMFQVDRFSAIINPPQACILAVGKGQKSVQWAKDGGTIETVTKMGLTLSADHRVFDGDIGGRFLKALTTNLTDPKNMLL